jgi:4-amino-4-deoxy-L-arabinose transferase-like glycosyltransferase
MQSEGATARADSDRNGGAMVRDFFDTPQRKPRLAAASYVLLVLLAWFVAWSLKGVAATAASYILAVPLLPSVLLAIPFTPESVLENSFNASTVLLAAGVLNTVIVYFVAKKLFDRSAAETARIEGVAPPA